MTVLDITLDDHVTVDIEMLVELSQTTVGDPFVATLVRQETRWFDDDPQPDYVETSISSHAFPLPLTEVRAAINGWLKRSHQLSVAPGAWRVCDTDDDTGVAVLLEGPAVRTGRKAA